MRYLIFLISLLFTSQVVSQAQRQGMDKALFFAVAQYEDDQLSHLPQTIKNARQIAQVLENKYGFDTEVVENPSLDDIEAKLSAYRQQYASGRLPKEGQLLIFFSGHGVKEFNNGYFLPADADADRILRTGLSYNTWRPFMSQINCKHIMVAIDACYSVTFDPDWQMMSGGSRFERPGGELSDEERLQANHSKYPARLFMTSDAKEDVVPGRSNFTRKTLEGLATFDGRFLSARELFANWIKKAAPTPAAGDFEGDDPRSSFLFIPKNRSNSVTERSNEEDLTPTTSQDNASPQSKKTSETITVKLIVNADYASSTYTLDGKPIYPITDTPTIKVFEIEYIGRPMKLEAKAGERLCTKMITISKNYFSTPYPILVTCAQ